MAKQDGIKERPNVNIRVFNIADPKERKEYLALVNNKNFNPLNVNEGGQVISVSQNWGDGGNFYILIEWFEEPLWENKQQKTQKK